MGGGRPKPAELEPTEEQLAFLRIVVREHPELLEQIESCRVGEYDPLGYLDVAVTSGPRLVYEIPIDGPYLRVEAEPPVDILLWLDDGYLACVEIDRYREFPPDDPPFAAFIEGAAAVPSQVLHSVKPPGYWIPYSRP